MNSISRSWPLWAILTLNIVFLVGLSSDFTTGEMRRFVAWNHLAQILAIMLVWGLGLARRRTDLYLTLAATGLLALGFIGQYSVLSMSLGWCLTALVTAGAVSRVTNKSRDRRAAASQSVRNIMDELKRARSLTMLKLFIGMIVLLDATIVIIYCLRPGIYAGLPQITSLALLIAICFVSFPALLATVGGRRFEMAWLAGTVALASLMIDLKLLLSVWGLEWADFIRLTDTLDYHLILGRFLGQIGVVFGLLYIIRRHLTDYLTHRSHKKSSYGEEQFSKKKNFRHLRKKTGNTLNSAPRLLAMIPLAAFLIFLVTASNWDYFKFFNTKVSDAGPQVTYRFEDFTFDLPSDFKMMPDNQLTNDKLRLLQLNNKPPDQSYGPFIGQMEGFENSRGDILLLEYGHRPESFSFPIKELAKEIKSLYLTGHKSHYRYRSVAGFKGLEVWTENGRASELPATKSPHNILSWVTDESYDWRFALTFVPATKSLKDAAAPLWWNSFLASVTDVREI